MGTSGASSAEADTSPLLARQQGPGEGITDDRQPVRASSSHPAPGHPSETPANSTAAERKDCEDFQPSAHAPPRPSHTPSPDPAQTLATGAGGSAAGALAEPSAAASAAAGAATAMPMAQGGTVTGIPLMPGAAWPPGFSYGVPLETPFGGHPVMPGTPLGYPLAGIPAGVLPPCPHSLGRAPVPPAGSRITVTVDPEGAEFRIPAPELGANEQTAGAVLTLAFAGIWLTFVFLQAAQATAEDVPLPFLAFFLPFLAAGLAVLALGLRALALTEAIRVRGAEVELEQQLWGWVGLQRLPRASLTHVELKVTEYLNRHPSATCCLAQGIREHELGFNLTPLEQHWLVAELSRCLRIPVRQPLPAVNRMVPLVPPPVTASL